MGLMSRIAAKNAAQNTTTANAPVINTPIAETPAPAPVAETAPAAAPQTAPQPAPQATAAPATVPAASAAGTPAPTPAPAPAPKKEWTPQDAVDRILAAVNAGTITLTDSTDTEGNATYTVSGDTKKLYTSIRAIGGTCKTESVNGNTTYTWSIRKDYIENPDAGRAIRTANVEAAKTRRAEKAAKAATQTPAATTQTATPAPTAAPTADGLITISEDTLTKIISQTVSQTIATLKAQGFLVTPAMTVSKTGSDDNLPF